MAEDTSIYGLLKNRGNQIDNTVNNAVNGTQPVLVSMGKRQPSIQNVNTQDVYGRTAQDQQLMKNDWWDKQLTYFSNPDNAMNKRNSLYDIRDALNQGAQRGYNYQSQPQFRGSIDNYLNRVAPYRNEPVEDGNNSGMPTYLGSRSKYYTGQ